MRLSVLKLVRDLRVYWMWSFFFFLCMYLCVCMGVDCAHTFDIWLGYSYITAPRCSKQSTDMPVNYIINHFITVIHQSWFGVTVILQQLYTKYYIIIKQYLLFPLSFSSAVYCCAPVSLRSGRRWTDVYPFSTFSSFYSPSSALMGFCSLASVFQTALVAPPMLTFLKLKVRREAQELYIYVNICIFLLQLISLRSQMKEWNHTAWSELCRHQSWSAALYLHLFKERELMFGNGLKDIKACDVMVTSQWQFSNLMRTGFVLYCCMLVSLEGKCMFCFV